MFITLYVGLLLCGKDGRGIHPPHPQRCLYTPPVHPCPSSAPGTAAHHRQQGRTCRIYQGRPRGADRTGGGFWTACNVSGKVYNFGRFILSTFIWIYFTKSIDNPYIYGYNIISPDKYGLQPQYTKTGGQKP